MYFLKATIQERIARRIMRAWRIIVSFFTTSNKVSRDIKDFVLQFSLLAEREERMTAAQVANTRAPTTMRL